MEIWLIWLIAGFVLMLLELLIPGGIVVFIGLAAALTAGLIKLNILNGIVDTFSFWFVCSIVFMFVLRSFFMKYFEGDSHKDNVDEDVDSKGMLVIVTETIYPHKEGRVKFRDSSWSARSDEEIEEGKKAIILDRDGSTWIVSSIGIKENKC